MEWIFREGPDFYLCHAVEASSKADVFGIYLGYHSSAELDPEQSLATGEVGGFSVTWYPHNADPAETPFSRQTVFTINSQSLQAHVWLSAATQSELDLRLAILKALRFR